MKFFAESMHNRGCPPFTVFGGPFARAQQYGWYITNYKGLSIAISNSTQFCERLNQLETLAHYIQQYDIQYHLSERRDQGYLDVPEIAWASFKELLKSLKEE